MHLHQIVEVLLQILIVDSLEGQEITLALVKWKILS